MAGQILIVDDHEAVRRAIRTLLSVRPEWSVCGEAGDGLEAIEKAKALRPDVILMDISMPRMDGLQATQQIRKALPSTKVIIVSQNDPTVVLRQAREVDAAGYVAKGLLSKELIPAIERIIGSFPVGNESVPESRPSEPAAPGWLSGGGELGHLILTHDWSKTPLGSIDSWPQSLKTSVNLILNSQHPMWIGWGPEATFLYNDAYIHVLSMAKHPWALGLPAAKVWAEIWDICGPLADKVFKMGEASFVDEVRLFMNRGNFLEETYYSFSYSPIRDESGEIAGLFCPSTEVTPKVINARRLRTLSELSARALMQRTTDGACASAVATLAKNADDVPFVALYLIDSENKTARLEQVAGIARGIDTLTPLVVPLDQAAGKVVWPIAGVAQSVASRVVPVQALDGLPLGPAQQRLSEAIVLPVTTRGQERPLGVLVAGVNPARQLDSEYLTFYELVAGQIATAVQNASTAEEEKKRIEALAEIDRAKTIFFSNVSHEFRTPLTLMLGPVEELLARSHTDLTPAAKTQLELVNRNGSRLLRLVNTLLDFSRIEAGRMQAMYQATDLPAFTAELASVFRSATEKAGLKLELDLPRLSEPVYVDRNMWEKIVLNLISNAFKFTFEGTIRVGLKPVGENIELRVRDTGVGIPAEEIPHLFDRFHRIENVRSRTHEGSGIGLALVQELVKLHGGTVRVKSTPDKGSTFIVSVPRGSAHLPADRIGGVRLSASTSVSAAPFVEEALRWLPGAGESDADAETITDYDLVPVPCPPEAPSAASADRPFILLADDNADMRQYLVRLLSERYEVKAVADGSAALEATRERLPGLVLTDVMMPILDGFGLLRELRADPRTKTLPVILLSARAGEESRVEGMEHGADDYLIKPFSARELLARVQTHLEMARMRQESEDALRQRTAQFATLLNEAPLGVFLVDEQLHIREANPLAVNAFGKVRNLIGQDFKEITGLLAPDDYADEIVSRFRQTLATGEPYAVAERVSQRRDRRAREIYEWQINRISLQEGGYGVVCYFREISSQVQSREAIAESEQRLIRALDVGGVGAWEWDLNTQKAWRSPLHDQIFGYKSPRPDWSFEIFLEHVLPEDREEVNRTFKAAIAGNHEWHFECRIRRADNIVRWIWKKGVVDVDEQGNLCGLKGMVRDITEYKEAERELSAHRQRFDLVAEAAQVGFWFCDLPFDKLIWDNRVKEHFWLAPDEDVTIETFYERLHPDDRERTRLAISESNVNDTKYDIEYRTVADDGREKWIRALGRTFYNAAGEPTRFDGVTLDVTERRHIEDRERAMREESVATTAKFRAIFEQTPVFAGIMALDGKLVDANRLSLEACGYRPEDVLGRPFWQTGWWRLSDKTMQKIREGTIQAAQGTPYRETLTYYWADGSEHLVDFSLHPIRDPEGNILFLHPTGIDITDLKRAEEDYRVLAETLEGAVQSRTRELEVRNTEVLLQSEQLRHLSRRLLQAQDEERRRIARELHDSAGQILTALAMSLARIVQNAKKDAAAWSEDVVDSERLVQQLSQEIRTMSYLLHPPLLDEAGLPGALDWYIRGLMDRGNLDIGLTISEDLGRLPREMELAMFRLVQECLTNIHRHSGSKKAMIEVSCENDTVVLNVQDEGKGISPEKLAEIQSRGAGVGIRGMRERVLPLGGEMSIQSNGQGTTISFLFPLDAEDVERAEKTRLEYRLQ
ncbi:MAG: response regulator [Acidobacteria bacterium]|nr:response regulator [Acidobacteriota bacterium]